MPYTPRPPLPDTMRGVMCPHGSPRLLNLCPLPVPDEPRRLASRAAH